MCEEREDIKVCEEREDIKVCEEREDINSFVGRANYYGTHVVQKKSVVRCMKT